MTDWFRSHAYYASGGWRASWAGEGRGVLLNQCPHNLELWWWLFGQPSQVRAFCARGRYYPLVPQTADRDAADGPGGIRRALGRIDRRLATKKRAGVMRGNTRACLWRRGR